MFTALKKPFELAGEFAEGTLLVARLALPIILLAVSVDHVGEGGELIVFRDGCPEL